MNDKNEPRIDDEGKKHYTLKAETGRIGLELPDLTGDWKSYLSQFHQIAMFAQKLGKPPTFAIEAIMNIDAAITELENHNAQMKTFLEDGLVIDALCLAGLGDMLTETLEGK